MKGLRIVPVRTSYFCIELDGVPVTNTAYTQKQAEDAYKIYEKVYNSGWNNAIDEVNEDL